jgi:hypothetical protein
MDTQEVSMVPTEVIIFKYVRKYLDGDTRTEFTLHCRRCSGAVYGKHTGAWASKAGAAKVAGEHADMHARVDAHPVETRRAEYGYVVVGSVTR